MISTRDLAAHTLSPEETAESFGTDVEAGLYETEAEKRLAEWGPNALPEEKGRTLFRAIRDQIANFLILLLLAATILSAAIGEYLDAGTIAAIVVLSAVLGVIQERSAERSLQALRAMMAPVARVVREGQVRELPGSHIVPGDIVLLEVGNHVPADLRLVRAFRFAADESSLTGESAVVHKDASLVLPRATLVADRQNCVFAGTIVTQGRAQGVAVATGANTEVGRIATLVGAQDEEPTPLERRMSGLGRWLGGGAVTTSVFVFIIGVATGKGTVDMLLTAVSLAVAAVPEGLPAVMTLTLALGMQRMSARRALMRRLAAVETLGSATVIASDKTGTLTKAEMTLVRIYPGPGEPVFDVTGAGYQPEGQFRENGRIVDAAGSAHLKQLLACAALCNDAHLQHEGGRWKIVGDTTEGALLVAAAKAGMSKREMESDQPRLGEIAFSAERKMMSTIHSLDGRWMVYLKGAPDVVLPRCSLRQHGEELVPMSTAEMIEVMRANEEMASQGLRVLALACRSSECELDQEEIEQDLVFLGLAGIQDPPRPEVREAVHLCHQAGIVPVMITGDHAATALAIARDLGIVDGGQAVVVTGIEIEGMSDERLRETAAGSRVYARISPEQKMRIVQALQANGHIVAVTGDGVNDAPALRKADIGVAMGITGTDVAKEAADMIITDDNFASIVAAVEEGRKIFDNIRNFVVYLLGANIGEVLVVFIGVASGLPTPLLAMQILWINLVTDSLPALALSMERGDPGAMQRPPRPPNESVVTRPIALTLAVRALVLGLAAYGAFVVSYEVFDTSADGARTVALATIILGELLKAFGSRSLYNTALHMGPFSNPYLVAATGLSFGLLMAVLYAPPLQEAFHTETLGLREWLIVSGFGSVPLLVIEGMKVSRWRLRQHVVI